MKISMYMLLEWFKDYETTAVINSGERKIEGVRLFSGETIHPDYLYVGSEEDFFQTHQGNAIWLIWQMDMICIQSDDINYIFNKVLNAFDFYNELENILFAALLQQDPEQKILDACEKLVGPMFIMSTDYRNIACTYRDNGVYVNQFWHHFVDNKELSLAQIGLSKDGVLLTLAREPQEMTSYLDPLSEPHPHGIISTYYDASQRMIGFFVMLESKPVTPYEKDIAGIILENLKTLQLRSMISDNKVLSESLETSLLRNLIQGIEVERNAEYLITLNEIPKDAEYHVVKVTNLEIRSRRSMRNELSYRFMDSVICTYEQEIVLLVWSDTLDHIIEKMERIQSRYPAKVSISNPFHDLEKASYYYQQASWIEGKATTQICLFWDKATESILTSNDMGYRLCARHPLVSQIAKAFPSLEKEFQETLKIYIISGQSVQLTAKELYIHRNTVSYRIRKMKEFFHIDFSNTQDMMYLLLSLMM